MGKAMTVVERIARNKHVQAIVRYMYTVSAWYMRRRSVTKGFLFFTFFVLPILLYAYNAAQPFINQVSGIASNTTTILYEPHAPPNYTVVSCDSVFKGRVFVAGPFSYTTCYYVNETHVLFSTGLYYGVIEFVSGKTQGNSYGISFVYESLVGNISTRYLVLIAVAENEDSASELLRATIERYGLGKKLCENFLPGTSFGGRFIYYKLYLYFCEV